MNSINLIRKDLRNMSFYSCTEVPATYRHHLNELPWSCINIPEVNVNEYPNEQDKNNLRTLLAEQYQVDADCLLLTRGSDEGIDLLMRLFLDAKRDAIVQCPPTFTMYRFFAGLQQAQVIDCMRDENLKIDLTAVKRAWSPRCKLIVLCSPNNPSGDTISLQEIADLCSFVQDQAIVIIDEAYIEFAEMQSATTLLAQCDNLVVLRTLSKAYGLAGLRIGCVIAQPYFIKMLSNIQAPYAFSSVVIATAIKALSNSAWRQKSIEKIVSSRKLLAKQLNKLPWIQQVYDSAANFLLIKTAYSEALLKIFTTQSIAVRSYRENPLLQNCIRISLGNATMNRQLWSLLRSFNPYSAEEIL